MVFKVRRLEAADEEAFRSLHATSDGGPWCHCVAWWVAGWEGWGERTAEENRSLRESLFARGEHDGYLLFEGAQALGWIQVGPRDRLGKLVRELALEPDPRTWALSCFYVSPDARGQGVAAALLERVLLDLRHRGIPRVEAYPRNAPVEGPGALWTGPRSLLERARFRSVREDDPRSVLALELGPG